MTGHEGRTATAVAVGLLVVSAAAFGVLVAIWTPWDPLPGASTHAAPLHRYFTSEQIQRSDAFFGLARWPSWCATLMGLVIAAVVAFSPIGRGLSRRVRARLRWWWLQVIALVVTVEVVFFLVRLPFAVWGTYVARDFGLYTQSWAGWSLDQLKSLGITVVTASIGLLVLIALARKLPRWWFLPASLGTGCLVVLLSFAYPLIVEPLFNSFTPLPAGQLRTDLLSMAHRDGLSVSDVLVADASRRTTTLNAYVSGFGASKRIVIYDTLLERTPRPEVELIVAHELGHAKHRDVLHGTVQGAVVGVAALSALYLGLRRRWLLRLVRARSTGDPALVPLILGLVVLVGFVVLPAQNYLSRHVEAHADAHSLQLTHNPKTYIAMQERLAVANLTHLTPNPVLAFWFRTHPPVLQRIGMAVAWERTH